MITYMGMRGSPSHRRTSNDNETRIKSKDRRLIKRKNEIEKKIIKIKYNLYNRSLRYTGRILVPEDKIIQTVN